MGSTLPVVVVDDDEDFLKFMEVALGLEGFESQPFRTAVGALNYLRCRTATLAIVDWHLPDFDGLHLVELLRREAIASDMPIIVTTAQPPARIDVLRNAASRLGTWLLLKPFTADMLATAIREARARKSPMTGSSRTR